MNLVQPLPQSFTQTEKDGLTRRLNWCFLVRMTQSGEESNNNPFSLRRQLELTRYERALTVSESMADHRVLLTTTELARLNNILTGKDEDPWRQGAVTIKLPSGKMETLAIVADPKLTAREKLHRATDDSEGGNVLDAAVDVYVGFVMAHVFKDANRRTAVLAAHYFLKRYGVPISGLALHEIGLGDLREPGQIEELHNTIKQMAKFVTKRNGV